MGSKTKILLYNPSTKMFLSKHGEFIEDGGESVDFGLLRFFVKKYWETKGVYLEYKSFMVYKKGFMGLV
jgi:hypothetical protein